MVPRNSYRKVSGGAFSPFITAVPFWGKLFLTGVHIVNRTYGIHKNLCMYPFLLSFFLSYLLWSPVIVYDWCVPKKELQSFYVKGLEPPAGRAAAENLNVCVYPCWTVRKALILSTPGTLFPFQTLDPTEWAHPIWHPAPTYLSSPPQQPPEAHLAPCSDLVTCIGPTYLQQLLLYAAIAMCRTGRRRTLCGTCGVVLNLARRPRPTLTLTRTLTLTSTRSPILRGGWGRGMGSHAAPPRGFSRGFSLKKTPGGRSASLGQYRSRILREKLNAD